MTAPARLDWIVYQGATFNEQISWKGGDPAEPIDLTGCVVRMQVRPDLASDVVLVECSTANGKIQTVPLNGEIRITISAAETEGFNWSKGVYDLEVEFPGGEVRRLVEGTMRVRREVTRG